jgi:hypothetical protein
MTGAMWSLSPGVAGRRVAVLTTMLKADPLSRSCHKSPLDVVWVTDIRL